MIKFTKYNSIENVTRDKMIKHIENMGFDICDYTVTEKIHGSNFSIWKDENEVKFAKRTSFIGEFESFMGSQTIKNELESFIEFISLHFEYNNIIIFGEIAGGSYPDKSKFTEELKVQNSKKVQSGVFYHPANFFYVFDIKVDGVYLNEEDFNKVRMYFNNHKNTFTPDHFSHILFSEVLFTGKFEDAINYSNEFQSTIPDRFGLPKIENNICEGIVIKPVNVYFFNSGSRVILKSKNNKFKEKRDTSKSKKVRKIVEYNDVQNTLISEIELYVTENRLRNVISKIGEIQDKDFGKLLGGMIKDIIIEYKKDNKIDENFNIVLPAIKKSITILIRKNFLNIIDGEF